jgi:hypothetical protein
LFLFWHRQFIIQARAFQWKIEREGKKRVQRPGACRVRTVAAFGLPTGRGDSEKRLKEQKACM